MNLEKAITILKKENFDLLKQFVEQLDFNENIMYHSQYTNNISKPIDTMSLLVKNLDEDTFLRLYSNKWLPYAYSMFTNANKEKKYGICQRVLVDFVLYLKESKDIKIGNINVLMENLLLKNKTGPFDCIGSDFLFTDLRKFTSQALCELKSVGVDELIIESINRLLIKFEYQECIRNVSIEGIKQLQMDSDIYSKIEIIKLIYQDNSSLLKNKINPVLINYLLEGEKESVNIYKNFADYAVAEINNLIINKFMSKFIENKNLNISETEKQQVYYDSFYNDLLKHGVAQGLYDGVAHIDLENYSKYFTLNYLIKSSGIYAFFKDFFTNDVKEMIVQVSDVEVGSAKFSTYTINEDEIKFLLSLSHNLKIDGEKKSISRGEKNYVSQFNRANINAKNIQLFVDKIFNKDNPNKEFLEKAMLGLALEIEKSNKGNVLKI